MKIAVVGTGYVGLVTGTCFAEKGYSVICVDNNILKLQKMQQGVIPIYEPGLEPLFKKNIANGRLSFTSDLKEATTQADIIFLALPTPPGEDGSADLSYILGVAKELGHLINGYKVIVNKSTVPVLTAEKVHNAIAENGQFEFDVISNPEFLREGLAVQDFMEPDRVVIGTTSEKARQLMKQLYAPFIHSGNQLIFMDERSSEMTKYAANAFLALKISFMNEIANLSEKVGANVESIRMGIGPDKRIGEHFLFPGIGYGGSCFPKDVQALSLTARQYDYDFKILEAVMDVNTAQKNTIVEKMLEYYDGNLKGKKIALWGLAFKPNTDDIREAPALHIIDQLLHHGAEISAYDPEAMENVSNLLGNKITFKQDHYECLPGADCLVIATEWDLFKTAELDKVAELLNAKVVFDGRNIYPTEQMETLGFNYFSVGRKAVVNSTKPASVTNE
jgi:UDPglucose 6-dehydrogenase